MDGLGAQNPDELFDIVNDADEVVGSARRSEIHAKRLLHRSVHAMVFDFSGRKILLQKRSLLKDSYAGKYTTSCSGHVDSGESYEEALVRETREELGIETRLEDYEFVGKISARRETGYEFTKVYILKHEGPFKFPPREVDSLEWMQEGEFARRIGETPRDFTPSFICAYRFYREKVPNS